MFQRLGLVAGVCAIAVVLWLLLQRPTARGGDLERGPAPAQARTEPDEPLAAPRAGTTSGDGTRVASEGTAAPALLDEIAPAPTRQLRVRVLDEFGAPVAAADVRMKIEDGESGQHNFSAVSGQDGLATFSRLDELHLMEGMEARVALAGLFEPPVEKSGSVTPVIGKSPRFTPAWISKCPPKTSATPDTTKRAKRSRSRAAVESRSATRNA